MSDAQQRIEDADDAPLIRDEITALFRGFLRYPSLLKDAIRLNLDEARFEHGELRYLAVFSAAKALYTTYRAVSREMLITQIASAIDVGSLVVTTEDTDFLFGPPGQIGFIDEAFESPALEGEQQRAERQFLENVLKRFLNVRLIKPRLQSALNRSTEDSVPTRIRDVLDRWGRAAQRVEHIGEIVANPARMPDVGEHIPLLEAPMTTGLPWIDQYIGGIRSGDVIGVIGPYTGGKTTVLTVAAVRMAELYASRGENKLSVFVGYEDGADRMTSLIWSAASRVERNAFISSGNLADVASETFWATLSTRDSLKDYDRSLPENRNGEIMFGELERWRNARAWLNQNFWYLDFGAEAATGGRGSGGVMEIKTVLERLMEELGVRIGFVAIDYCGLMVERHLIATGGPSARTEQSAITRPMRAASDDLRVHIARPMGCTVMLAHQVAQHEAKKLPPYKYVNHADAAGSKSFAENLHSCMCINASCPTTRVRTINWSKIRMGLPPCGTPYGLIRMDDNYADVHLVNDQYVADSASHAILRRGDVRVAAPVEAPPVNAGASRRPGWSSDSFAGDI